MWSMISRGKYNTNPQLKYFAKKNQPSYEDVLECLDMEFIDIKESIDHFINQKFAAYDAHVGETNCQTRAFMVCLLYSAYSLEGRHSNLKDIAYFFDGKREIIRAVRAQLSKDREQRKDMPNFSDDPSRKNWKDISSMHPFPKSVNVCSWLEKHDLTLDKKQLHCDLWNTEDDMSCAKLLYFLYVLTKYREKVVTQKNVPSYRITEMVPLVRNTLVESMQAYVAGATVEFINKLHPDRPVDSRLICTRNTRLPSVATWISWGYIRDYWVKKQHPLLVLSRFYYQDGDAICKYKLWLLFRPNGITFVPENETTLTDDEPVVIVKGDSYLGNRSQFLQISKADISNNRRDMFKYKSTLINNILDALNGFFAIHPAYAGNEEANKMFPQTLKLVDSSLYNEYIKDLKTAEEIGSSTENMKLFLPQHMYTVNGKYAKSKMAKLGNCETETS